MRNGCRAFRRLAQILLVAAGSQVEEPYSTGRGGPSIVILCEAKSEAITSRAGALPISVSAPKNDSI